jgi:hypothetical protein
MERTLSEELTRSTLRMALEHRKANSALEIFYGWFFNLRL